MKTLNTDTERLILEYVGLSLKEHHEEGDKFRMDEILLQLGITHEELIEMSKTLVK